MASAVARTYNRGLIRRSEGSGGPPAKVLLIFGCLMEAAYLSTFLKFRNAKKSDICVIFAKSTVGHETGGPNAKLGKGYAPHRPGPKTAAGAHKKKVGDKHAHFRTRAFVNSLYSYTDSNHSFVVTKSYFPHVSMYAVGHKKMPLYFCSYLCQLLTDFQNSSTGTLCRQIAIM